MIFCYVELFEGAGNYRLLTFFLLYKLEHYVNPLYQAPVIHLVQKDRSVHWRSVYLKQGASSE